MRYDAGLNTSRVVIVVFLISLLTACSSVRVITPAGARPESGFPAVVQQTSTEVGVTDGLTADPAMVSDTASGAGVMVPTGTLVLTDDPSYDTDGDGIADTFAAGIAPLSVVQQATSQASADGGATFTQVEFNGGVVFTPTDAWLDPPVQLDIPLAADAEVTAGQMLDVWRYTDNRTTSQIGSNYWQSVGQGKVFITADRRFVAIMAQLFGAYALALSMPTGANSAPTISSITAEPPIAGIGEMVTLSCSADDPDGDSLSYQWTGDGNFNHTSTSMCFWSVEAAGIYPLYCIVSDGQGHTVTGQVHVVVDAAGNHAPVITSLTADPTTVEVGGTVTLVCTATDPDGDELYYHWSGMGIYESLAVNSTTWRIHTVGAYTITCTVSDGQGRSASESVDVTVVEPDNQVPVITAISAEPSPLTAGDTAVLSCLAIDADEDTLSYAWSGPGQFADSSLAGTTWNHDTAGDYTLTCTVTDGNGGSVSEDVGITVVADTEPPAWPADDAGLAAAAREGFVLLDFNEATDEFSAPVGYTVYYGEAAGFDQATATSVPLADYPTMPYRLDGLTLGTEYTFGVVATDAAAEPNSTALVIVNATPRPYYDAIPTGDHDFGVNAKFSDLAAVAGSDRALMVAWADPLSGTLRQGYYTDGAWTVQDISSAKTYVIPQVVFIEQLPVVVAADDAGGLDLLRQGLDGQWETTALFTRAGEQHVAVDALYDGTADRLYIGHITQDAGPPRVQTLHFLAVDMSQSPPVTADQIDDHVSDPYVGQVQLRLDPAGDVFMIYGHGEGTFAQPNWLDTELVFAAYDPDTGFTTEVAGDFDPLFFDARATATGWELAITDCELLVIGANDFMYTVMRLATGAGASWNIADAFTEDATLDGTLITYDAPLECILGPAAGSAYFTRGAGQVDLGELQTTATLSLWSAAPPAAPVAETTPLSHFMRLNTGTADFMLGLAVTDFEFHNVTDQLEYPAGNLELREVL